MDALPVEEETGLPYASRIPGRMHACGHDVHTACLVGAARLLVAEADRLPFRVRLVFQAGEEGFFGALPLIEAGVLDGVCAIVGGHVGALSGELGPGQAGFLHGPMMAASDRFEGAFSGSGGHGSEPQRTRDPIAALAEFILALYTFRARELDQVRPSVVSVCSVHAGTTHNVIPGHALFQGTARSLHGDIRAFLSCRIPELARGIADLHGLDLAFRWLEGYPPLVNHPEASRLAMEAAAEVLGPSGAVLLERPSMGGEDFTYYLGKVPGCFWFLDTRPAPPAPAHPNHNPHFDVDEDRLWTMIAVHLAAAERFASAFGKEHP
jgi:amidohydrolase